MSFNRFGQRFTFTSWGESHSDAIGCVVDGCPPGIELSESDIQPLLDKRKPGLSKHTTQRKEADIVLIQSGVYMGKTTGTPIHLMIKNTDQRSKDYDTISSKIRPNHADLTYLQKYGLRDPRGGGRSSARETAMRVAAGAIANKILLLKNIKVRAAVSQIGSHSCNIANWDWDFVNNNSLFCPDRKILETFETYIDKLRHDGDSCGAIIECECLNVPAGLGEPVYGKIDADFASAMMGINAVKGIEIGDGFAMAKSTGFKVADSPIATSLKEATQTWDNIASKRVIKFKSNHAGGILGGITTGQTIRIRVAFKPTSSIRRDIETINSQLQKTMISTTGRHDPCVGIRAVPIVEAMARLVIADHLLRHQAQCGSDNRPKYAFPNSTA